PRDPAAVRPGRLPDQRDRLDRPRRDRVPRRLRQPHQQPPLGDAVSLTDRIPGRREKPRRKHRADDRIAALQAELATLRDENVKLLNRQAAADDYFALITEDATVTNQAWRREKER